MIPGTPTIHSRGASGASLSGSHLRDDGASLASIDERGQGKNREGAHSDGSHGIRAAASGSERAYLASARMEAAGVIKLSIPETILSSNIFVHGSEQALDLLLEPNAARATLRF